MPALQTVRSENNSTIVPLGIGASFIGPSDALVSFEAIDVNVAGAPSVAPGTLFVEFSPDATHWDQSYPFPLTGPSAGVPLPFHTGLPFFRVRYVNGGTALTELRITTLFHRNVGSRSIRFLGQTLDPNEPVDVVRVAQSVLPANAATEQTVGTRFAGAKHTSGTTITASGDTTIYTPASGKKLTLFWVFLSASQGNVNEALATVRLGAKVAYTVYLGAPGAFGHWEPILADNPNDPLIVNLSAAANVAVSFTTTEA